MAEEETTEKSAKPGCATLLFIVGLAAIGGGAFLMTRWDVIPGLSKAGAVILIVLGTLLALPFILVTGLTLVIKYIFGRALRDIAKAGEALVSQNKGLYGRLHDFRSAVDSDFEPLDRNRYEATAAALSDAGYRHLGDVVDQTVEESGGPSAVIRVMASFDGTTTAAFYHFLMPKLPKGSTSADAFIHDITTEFSDGTFLITSNTAGLNAMTPPPGLDNRMYPVDTPVAELIRIHETEKQKALAARPGITCVTIGTLDQALESEKRQQAIKNKFRQEIGYVDPEEVRRVASTTCDDPTIADLSAQAADQARRHDEVGQ